MPYHVTIGKELTAKEHKTVFAVIEKIFTEVHERFDNWNPHSEVSQINAALKETLIPLSPPMQNILTLCDKIVHLSGGRFDPTIEPLGTLWREEGKSPNIETLQKACDAVGWNHLAIHNGILKKGRDGTRLDLCAIAKGQGIDWIVEALHQLGIEDLMVEWAGEIRAMGHHPENRDWLVPINPALMIGQKPMAPIPLRNSAIATSGVCRHQIIDPSTAAPLEQTEYSVAYAAVIAPTAALADALSTTALLFATRKEAESWAQEVVELYPDVRFWILSRK
ncbi:MAG: FAD:protein FMN transferase [Chlamydiales bacterium]